MSVFAQYLKLNGCFVVRNVSPDEKKTIKIFHYPINWGETRDILQIPGVDESDIKGSLLKGELNHKIRAKDIVVVCSDIELLQLNVNQKKFLQDAGIVRGVEVTSYLDAENYNPGASSYPYLFKEDVRLIGAVDGVNRVFTVPAPDKFLHGSYTGNTFKICVSHNGHLLFEDIDFSVFESGGDGTGYDTIVLKSFTPRINHSILYASYVIKNN